MRVATPTRVEVMSQQQYGEPVTSIQCVYMLLCETSQQLGYTTNMIGKSDDIGGLSF